MYRTYFILITQLFDTPVIYVMGTQSQTIKLHGKSLLTDSKPNIQQEPTLAALPSLQTLHDAFLRAQSSIEQQNKAVFHTYIACQKRNQPYLALKYANECVQLRKIAKTIQEKHLRARV